MEATPRIENKTDKYLTKSPHNTNGDRAALLEAELLASLIYVETLTPRGEGEHLRRTPIVASKKTPNCSSVDE